MPIFHKVESFLRGWIIGDFTPSLLRTQDFEICIVSHKKNEKSSPHYHTSSTEINVVLSGNLEVNGSVLRKHDIFIYERNEVSNVRFISDSELCVIRVPSKPDDKVII